MNKPIYVESPSWRKRRHVVQTVILIALIIAGFYFGFVRGMN